MVADSPDVLIGPVEVGTTATSFLFGCLAIQTYVYYSRFSADSLIIKILVASVVTVEFAHLICVGVALWQMTIGSYGNPAPLSVFPYAADTVIALTIVVSFCVQSFFALRLLRLSGSRVLPSMCLAMSTLFAVSGFVVTAKAFAMTSVVEFVRTQFFTITLSLTAGAMCDLMITAGLIYNLIRMRASSFSQTSRLIDILILWTIETGLAPCICAFMIVACVSGPTLPLVIYHVLLTLSGFQFALMRENYVWTGIYEILAGIYANSLLAVYMLSISLYSNLPLTHFSMNSRSFIRGRDMDGLVELRPRGHQEHQSSNRPSQPAIVINITRSTESRICRGGGKETTQGTPGPGDSDSPV
ncbi:hypothetical protein BV22DRAFT_1082361 [Leucogyrophana mollusca]|uniref:Uncharacterized protein n=1 Tax=Leucogyrophana mollusca TaxID=85980 RepID=A0ACB8BTP3_9AGAM|nr:hypothetical protein BV22DRAFT_1082361 [Leucogyrophana mollusca]